VRCELAEAHRGRQTDRQSYLVQVSSGEPAGEDFDVRVAAAAAESTAVRVLVSTAAGPYDSRPDGGRGGGGGGGGAPNHASADRLVRGTAGGGG